MYTASDWRTARARRSTALTVRRPRPLARHVRTSAQQQSVFRFHEPAVVHQGFQQVGCVTRSSSVPRRIKRTASNRRSEALLCGVAVCPLSSRVASCCDCVSRDCAAKRPAGVVLRRSPDHVEAFLATICSASSASNGLRNTAKRIRSALSSGSAQVPGENGSRLWRRRPTADRPEQRRHAITPVQGPSAAPSFPRLASAFSLSPICR